MSAAEELQKAEAARAMIRAVVMDGFAEINTRRYYFTKMVHKQRRKVFAFYSKVAPQVNRHDFSFLDSDEFGGVEAVINDTVTFNDSLLSRLGDHWEKYPEDYLTFISTAMAVISYPFLAGSPTD